MQIIKDRFQEIIVSVFPEAENKRVVPSSDLIIELSWHLHNDPTRKNKLSKTLRISISEEQIEDYENLQLDQKNQFDKKLKELISLRKSQYDPNHGTRHGSSPALEEWPIVV